MSNLQEDVNQGIRNALVESEQMHDVFSLSEKDVQFRHSQVLSDSLITQNKADTGGLGTATINVESESQSVSMGECVFEGFQTDQKLCTNPQGQMQGKKLLCPSLSHNIVME